MLLFIAYILAAHCACLHLESCNVESKRGPIFFLGDRVQYHLHAPSLEPKAAAGVSMKP